MDVAFRTANLEINPEILGLIAEIDEFKASGVGTGVLRPISVSPNLVSSRREWSTPPRLFPQSRTVITPEPP